jgi:hypothetical protein
LPTYRYIDGEAGLGTGLPALDTINADTPQRKLSLPGRNKNLSKRSWKPRSIVRIIGLTSMVTRILEDRAQVKCASFQVEAKVEFYLIDNESAAPCRASFNA